MGTIKINNQSIAKLYLGNIAVKRAYSNGSIVYDTGVQPTPQPCFEAVDTISQASGDYVDVYAWDTAKWYKKNNLSQYEKYGIMPIVDDLSTLTTYVGKLALLKSDEHEYRWDGTTWVDLGRAGTWTYKYWLNSISSAPEFNINYHWGTGYKAVLDFYLNSTTMMVGGNIVFKNVNTSVFLIENGGYALDVETYKPASDQDNTVQDASTSRGNINTSTPLFFTDREHLLIIKNDSIETHNVDGSLIGKDGTDQNITGWYNGFYESIIRPYYSDSYAKYKVGYLKIYDNNDNLIHDIQLKMNRNLSASRKLSYYDHVTGTEYTNTTNNNIDYDEIINDIDIVVDYDTKVAPANHVHYNTLAELELMECPWVGMHATIGENNDPYVYTANGWVPAGRDYREEYLTIESLDDNNVIGCKVTRSESGSNRTLYYSTDGETWNSANIVYNGTTIATLNTGDVLYLKGDHIKNNWNNHMVMSSSGRFNVYGNILSLMYMDEFSTESHTESDEVFCEFFKNTGAVDAANLVLPVVHAPMRFCHGLFSDCTSLISMPDLSHITHLGSWAFEEMFKNCTSLKCDNINISVSAESSTTNHFYKMFGGCTSLDCSANITIDTAKGSFNNMFIGCTSLKSVIINVTTFSGGSESTCANMCNGCTSLEDAEINYNGRLPNPGNYDTQTIFYRCFYNCSNLKRIKAMFTTIGSHWSGRVQTTQWVSGVSATGTFIKNVNATWNKTGVSGVPTGWTVETANP